MTETAAKFEKGTQWCTNLIRTERLVCAASSVLSFSRHYVLCVPVKCSRQKNKRKSTKTQFLYDLTQGIAADEDVDGARLEPRQHLLPLHFHQAGQLSCTVDQSIILIQSINQST
jgi:hypothetical protein